MTRNHSGPSWLELAPLLILVIFAAIVNAAPLHDESTELQPIDDSLGCYYNFNHYGEGDRILTGEPCLNCTCHNKMLMCYLRVCPFTKPIGQDCVIEKREDQCCPIITCPEVPVGLIESESQSTEVGSVDRFGCSIDGKFYSEGSQVPSNPKKPCELCYCIHNMTSCVMQECTLHVDGCRPIYNRGVCCPVRYDCEHDDGEKPLQIEDATTTTVRPTPGFILTTTMPAPPSTECVHNGDVYADGALIKTINACEHCYCMKGDIVCAVQECLEPLENRGKHCTARPPKEGKCCPDEYDCDIEGTTLAEEYDRTTVGSVVEDEIKVDEEIPHIASTEAAEIEGATTLKSIEDKVEVTSQGPSISEIEDELIKKIQEAIQKETATRIAEENESTTPVIKRIPDEEDIEKEDEKEDHDEEKHEDEKDDEEEKEHEKPDKEHEEHEKDDEDDEKKEHDKDESDEDKEHDKDEDHDSEEHDKDSDEEHKDEHDDEEHVTEQGHDEEHVTEQDHGEEHVTEQGHDEEHATEQDHDEKHEGYDYEHPTEIPLAPFTTHMPSHEEPSEAGEEITTHADDVENEIHDYDHKPEHPVASEIPDHTALDEEEIRTTTVSKIQYPSEVTTLPPSSEEGEDLQEHLDEIAEKVSDEIEKHTIPPGQEDHVPTEDHVSPLDITTVRDEQEHEPSTGRPIESEDESSMEEGSGAEDSTLVPRIGEEGSSSVPSHEEEHTTAIPSHDDSSSTSVPSHEEGPATESVYEHGEEKVPETLTQSPEVPEQPQEVPTEKPIEKEQPTTPAHDDLELPTREVFTERLPEIPDITTTLSPPLPVDITEEVQTMAPPESDSHMGESSTAIPEEIITAKADEKPEPVEDEEEISTPTPVDERPVFVHKQDHIPARKDDEHPEEEILTTTGIPQLIETIPESIPGEGDCLLDGVTYLNNTSVPAPNRCQVNCYCFNSLVKCDMAPECIQPIPTISDESLSTTIIPESSESPVDQKETDKTDQDEVPAVVEEIHPTTEAGVAESSPTTISSEIPEEPVDTSFTQKTEKEDEKIDMTTVEKIEDEEDIDRTTFKSLIPAHPDKPTESPTDEQNEIVEEPTTPIELAKPEEHLVESTTLSIPDDRKTEEEKDRLPTVSDVETPTTIQVESSTPSKEILSPVEAPHDDQELPSDIPTTAGSAFETDVETSTSHVSHEEESSVKPESESEEPEVVKTEYPELETQKPDVVEPVHADEHETARPNEFTTLAEPVESEGTTLRADIDHVVPEEQPEKPIESEAPVTEADVVPEIPTSVKPVEDEHISESGTTVSAPVEEEGEHGSGEPEVSEGTTVKSILDEGIESGEHPTTVKDAEISVDEQVTTSRVPVQPQEEEISTAKIPEQEPEYEISPTTVAADVSPSEDEISSPPAPIDENEIDQTVMQVTEKIDEPMKEEDLEHTIDQTTQHVAVEGDKVDEEYTTPIVEVPKAPSQELETPFPPSEEQLPTTSAPQEDEVKEPAVTTAQSIVDDEKPVEVESESSEIPMKEDEVETETSEKPAEPEIVQSVPTETPVQPETVESESPTTQRDETSSEIEGDHTTPSIVQEEITTQSSHVPEEIPEQVHIESDEASTPKPVEETPAPIESDEQIQGETSVRPQEEEESVESSTKTIRPDDELLAESEEPVKHVDITTETSETLPPVQPSEEPSAIIPSEETTPSRPSEELLPPTLSPQEDEIPSHEIEITTASQSEPSDKTTSVESELEVSTSRAEVETSKPVHADEQETARPNEFTTLAEPIESEGTTLRADIDHVVPEEQPEKPIESEAPVTEADVVPKIPTSVKPVEDEHISEAGTTVSAPVEEDSEHGSEEPEHIEGTSVKSIIDEKIADEHLTEQPIEQPEQITTLRSVEQDQGITTQKAEEEMVVPEVEYDQSTPKEEAEHEVPVEPIDHIVPQTGEQDTQSSTPVPEAVPTQHEQEQESSTPVITSSEEPIEKHEEPAEITTTAPAEEEITTKKIELNIPVINADGEFGTTLFTVETTSAAPKPTTVVPAIKDDEQVTTVRAEQAATDIIDEFEEKPSKPVEPEEHHEDEAQSTTASQPEIEKEQITTTVQAHDEEISTTLKSIIDEATHKLDEKFGGDDEDTKVVEPSTTDAAAPHPMHVPEEEDEDVHKPISFDTHGEPDQETTAHPSHVPSSHATHGPHDTGYPSYPVYEDYNEEDDTTAFGPGTCRYGGKLYVSAQQIPRDDPCDFCFCFRSDIICLQQSCPPPIGGCREEAIHGFCCPRYECPVSMATVLNITTSTTTTTTTLPPHFLHHAYNGAATRRGCWIKGQSYKVGDVIRSASGPCMHCTCGGDGHMQCDPKVCTPEPMLRQMIAVAATKRR